MLPAFLPNCRMLTYDWNANIDKDAETQSLLGHADKLLLKLSIERVKVSFAVPSPAYTYVINCDESKRKVGQYYSSPLVSEDCYSPR